MLLQVQPDDLQQLFHRNMKAPGLLSGAFFMLIIIQTLAVNTNTLADNVANVWMTFLCIRVVATPAMFNHLKIYQYDKRFDRKASGAYRKIASRTKGCVYIRGMLPVHGYITDVHVQADLYQPGTAF
jgi:hypothetical protein